MVQEYRSCAEALKARHLWSIYHRRPKEMTYLRRFLAGGLVGLVVGIFDSSRSTTFGSMGGLDKAVSITWPVWMKLKTGVSELSATETDGRDLALSSS
jgi:hypothetical protein